MIPKDLKHFTETEFGKHPELVDPEAAYFLDQIRTVYDNVLVITDAARTPQEVVDRQNQLQGGSSTSLHALGRAFDLRWPVSEGLVFRLVASIGIVAQDTRYKDKVELELDFTVGNEHVHVGLRLLASGSTLILRKVK